MPVIQPSRQGLNIGGVQLQANDVSLPSMVSEVSVDTSKAKRLAALSGFVQDFGVGFDEAVKENAAAATVRGAMDAQGAVDAMASKDEAVQKQNIFVREAYQDGYVSAAAYDTLAKWRTDSVARAKKAAESGLTDEEFQQQEQEHVQSMSDKLGMYLPDMSKQSATTILQQLRATSMANYTAFQKGRAAFALAQADRALDRGLSASSDEFYQRLQAGQGAAAQMSIKTGLDSILAAEHLDKSKKLDRAKQYLVSVALINISLGVGEFAQTGWLAYPPLSGHQYSPGVGVDYWIWSLQISGLGTLLTGVNCCIVTGKQIGRAHV